MTAVGRRVFPLLLLLGLTACGDEEPAVASRFQPGQAWTYATRPGEEDSRVRVLKLERRGSHGVVVHVAVDGLRIANPRGATAEERTIPVISHIPIRESALEQSVTDKVDDRTEVPPDWERGYERWRDAYREGAASVWDKPLAEVIGDIATALVGGGTDDR